MSLTDTAVRNAKPGSKPRKRWDVDGLFLLMAEGGGKLWRLKYRFGGKEKLLALGAYPEVSLKAARERRDAARALLAQGIDPVSTASSHGLQSRRRRRTRLRRWRWSGLPSSRPHGAPLMARR